MRKMIQIYFGKKNFDTQKAERYFKERRIQVQMLDLKNPDDAAADRYG